METNYKHTAGKWERGTNTNSNEWMKIYCNGKVITRSLELNKIGNRKAGDFEEEEANAKLIAAAPKLLEALQEALNIIDRLGEQYRDATDKHDSFTQGEFKRLTAAIKQATE